MTLPFRQDLPASTAGGRSAAWLGLFAILLPLGWSATAPAFASVPAVCVAQEDDDSDEEAGEASSAGTTSKKTRGTGIKFDLWGACAEVSGSLTGSQQRQLQSDPSGFSGLVTRRGTPAKRTTVHTITATGRLETTRKTSLGELKTAGEVTWSVDDDSGIGTGTFSELYGSLAGVTVGYTESLMNFWSGEFSFNATAPKRTVGLLSYKFDLSDAASITAAVESGPPTSRSSSDGLRSITTDNPVLSTRFLYETDDLTVHLSGILREARFEPNTLLPFLNRSTTRTGYAVSFGTTVPVKALGEDDEFSMQATYASDASSYLGTAQDLSSLSNTLRTTGPTVGWSVVGSLHHDWSEQWKSNVFVSYLALDAELRTSQPTVRTKRAGANLQFLPVENLSITGELGYVDTQLNADRVVGLFNGTGGRALISYVTVEWKF
jgi:hypothetical protein